MTNKERELLTHRIASGILRCRTSSGLYLIKSPSPEEKYIAEEIFNDTYATSVIEDGMDEDAFETFLEERNVWGPVHRAKLEQLNKNLEDLKVALFNSYLNSNSKVTIKEAVRKTKREISALLERKHSYDYVSANGVALLQKAKFLTAMSVWTFTGVKLFTAASYWASDSKVLEDISNEMNRARITEEQYRELARNDPWRAIWFTRKAVGDRVFSCSSSELGDEQKTLVYWSQIYDNIHEHPKAPPEDIIKDDDALDGWFIHQSRERKKQSDREWLEDKITNPDIKRSSEVFVVTSREDASKVYNANDGVGRAKQKALFKRIEKEGVLEVQNQPDAVLEKAQQLTTMYKEKVMNK